MDKVVQSSAANAEETASSSQELSGQADLLKGAVANLLQLVGNSGAARNLGVVAPSAQVRRATRPLDVPTPAAVQAAS